MSTPTTKAHHLARTLVFAPVGIRFWAAWDLLDAVRELFPEKFAELEVMRDDLHDEFRRGEVLDPRSYTPDTLPEPLQERIHLWAKSNRISCDAVEKMAALIVAGDTRPPMINLELNDNNGNPVFTIQDAKGNHQNVLLIRADPLAETLDEFVVRAKAHYNQVCAFYQKLGFKRGPLKRERDHYLYLAANRVGRYTWAQLEDGKTPLNLPTRAPGSIANEVHKTAKFIGLPLKRGRPPRRP